MLEPSANYSTLDENRNVSKSFQNSVETENDSDRSFPVIPNGNKSLLDSFKEINSLDPHERMKK